MDYRAKFKKIGLLLSYPSGMETKKKLPKDH